MNTFLRTDFARRILRAASGLVAAWIVLAGITASAQTTTPASSAQAANYRLAPGDQVHVTVFQSPDMTVDARVSEDGFISFPLIGAVQVGSLDVGSAERKIAAALKQGGYLKDPQVNIQVTDIRGNMVAVLGQVNRAGTFPLFTSMRVSQAIAAAGGITPAGDDRVVVTGDRNGQAFRREVNLTDLYQEQSAGGDFVLAGGDSVYVPRAPTFYVYGEVLKPGNYRLERNMTMRQAIAAGGGLTLRGTERRLKVVRNDAKGVAQKVSVELDDPVLSGDVLYVAESYF